MLLAKTNVTRRKVLGALFCGLLIFDVSASAADWDGVPSAAPGDGAAPRSQSTCPDCTPPGTQAVRVQPEPVQVAGFPRGTPVLLMPQASRPDAAASAPQHSDHPYWSKRRLAVLAVGLGLAGTGAAMWAKGKDLPNSNYNPSACQASFNSGPIPFNPNFCNETVPSTGKKVGLVFMIAGGPVSLAGFLVHGL